MTDHGEAVSVSVLWARPAHWFDDHLLDEVLFVKPPTAAQKAALASTLENSSAGTSVELTETLWSGRRAHPRHYR